jgi:hypothetical protein
VWPDESQSTFPGKESPPSSGSKSKLRNNQREKGKQNIILSASYWFLALELQGDTSQKTEVILGFMSYAVACVRTVIAHSNRCTIYFYNIYSEITYILI